MTLHDFLTQQGLTDAAFAERCSEFASSPIHKSRIGRIRKGLDEPRAHTAQAIVLASGGLVTLADLVPPRLRPTPPVHAPAKKRRRHVA